MLWFTGESISQEGYTWGIERGGVAATYRLSEQPGTPRSLQNTNYKGRTLLTIYKLHTNAVSNLF